MYPVMASGQWAATTEFKVNLLRPVRDGVLRARAGERLAAAGQGTVSIQDPK